MLNHGSKWPTEAQQESLVLFGVILDQQAHCSLRFFWASYGSLKTLNGKDTKIHANTDKTAKIHWLRIFVLDIGFFSTRK